MTETRGRGGEAACCRCGQVDTAHRWMSENESRYEPGCGRYDVLWTYCKSCDMWTEHLPQETTP